MFSTPRSASWLPVIANAFLVAVKLAVGFVIGSISVLSDGLDSSADLISSFIAFGAIRFASRPPDAGHPFGHGKAENVSGVVESLLILGGAGYITYRAIERIRTGATLGLVELGIAVMVVSLLTNFLVSRHLLKVARAHDSLALESSARHRASDVFTSLGVLAGLVAIRISGVYLLDPIIALGVAAFVAWIGVRLFLKAFSGLMDVSLPREEEEAVREVVGHYAGEAALKELRTRKAGGERHIGLILLVCQHVTVGDSHRLVDRVEHHIQGKLPHSRIDTHVEPCTIGGAGCSLDCPLDCPFQRARPEGQGQSFS